MENPQRTRSERLMRTLYKNSFQVIIIFSVILGFAVGFFIQYNVTLTRSQLVYIQFPSVVLMRLLQMICIPLVVPNIIIGVASMSVGVSKTIALHLVLYVATTNILAVLNGLFLVMWLQPGGALATPTDEELQASAPAALVIRDFLKNLVPRNVFLASYSSFGTEINEISCGEDHGKIEFLEQRKRGINLLGVIIWSVITGLMLCTGEKPGETTLEILHIISEGTRNVVASILNYLPVGLFFMIASTVAESQEYDAFVKLAAFALTFNLGIFIHVVIVLPLIYVVICRKNPIIIVKGCYPAFLTAFFVSSSSATLPQTIKCCEKNLRIDKRVTRFMLPIVTTVNMNGTTLFEVVAAIFISQMNAINLTMPQITTVTLLCFISALGTSGIPSQHALTTFFILSAAGLPIKNTSLLVTLEWLLDRVRTVANVYGDCFGVSFIENLAQAKLKRSAMHARLISAVPDAVDISDIEINNERVREESESYHTGVE